MSYTNRLLNILGEVTHSGMKRQMEFLKAENTILRRHCLHKHMHLSFKNKKPT